jgi:hypothetical protein
MPGSIVVGARRPHDADDKRVTKALELRTVAERRHNGGLTVKVYELARSGTFTLNMPQGTEPGGLSMFASPEEAQQSADARLLADGHDCKPLGCRPWTSPDKGSRSRS